MNILAKNELLALVLVLLTAGSTEAATRSGRVVRRSAATTQAPRHSIGLPANTPAPSWASHFLNQWAAGAQARALASPGRRLAPSPQPAAPQVQPQAGALIIAPQPTLTGAPSPTQIFAVEAGNGFAQNFQGGQPIDDRSGFFEGPKDCWAKTPQTCGGSASGGNAITSR